MSGIAFTFKMPQTSLNSVKFLYACAYAYITNTSIASRSISEILISICKCQATEEYTFYMTFSVHVYSQVAELNKTYSLMQCLQNHDPHAKFDVTLNPTPFWEVLTIPLHCLEDTLSWAVNSVFPCPNRLCTQMPGQTQLSRWSCNKDGGGSSEQCRRMLSTDLRGDPAHRPRFSKWCSNAEVMWFINQLSAVQFLCDFQLLEYWSCEVSWGMLWNLDHTKLHEMLQLVGKMRQGLMFCVPLCPG